MSFFGRSPEADDVHVFRSPKELIDFLQSMNSKVRKPSLASLRKAEDEVLSDFADIGLALFAAEKWEEWNHFCEQVLKPAFDKQTQASFDLTVEKLRAEPLAQLLGEKFEAVIAEAWTSASEATQKAFKRLYMEAGHAATLREELDFLMKNVASNDPRHVHANKDHPPKYEREGQDGT